jgi:hypothetical protein
LENYQHLDYQIKNVEGRGQKILIDARLVAVREHIVVALKEDIDGESK